jgi:hypothetical protein
MSHSTHSKQEVKNSPIGVEEAKKLLASIQEMVGPAPALSVKDRKRSLKLRKGGETVIPTVVALSEQFGLNVASHPTSEIMAKLNQAQSLIPLHKQLVTMVKHVADVIFAAHSASWEGSTVHYSMLRRLSKTDGDLETALAPVTEFFAQKKAAAKPTAAEATAGATTPAASSAPAAPATATPVTPATASNGVAHS